MRPASKRLTRLAGLRSGLTRTQRSESTRRALVDAAARVVGRCGYADASVARITQEAGVAQGTFYNYFESRQDLLDQLLPALGREMIDYIGARVKRITDAEAREEAQFRAFFAFLVEHPEFYRVLHEADQFAPDAYRQHLEYVEHGYLRLFRRMRGRGQVADFDDRTFEVIAYVLMAARDYLGTRYALKNGRVQPVPDWVVDAYMGLLRHGLFARPQSAADGDGDAAEPEPPRDSTWAGQQTQP